MKSFKKDIIATLLLKLSLLFLLWFICFKPIEKNKTTPLTHFLGPVLTEKGASITKNKAINNFQTKEVNYVART